MGILQISCLQSIRKKHNLSCPMMAGILDVSRQRYWGWESGRHQMPPAALSRLEKIFGIRKQFRRTADWQNKTSAADIGKILRRLIAEKNLSPKQAARLLDISYGYYRKIEKGTVVPSRDFYKRFCRAIKIPVSILRKERNR